MRRNGGFIRENRYATSQWDGEFSGIYDTHDQFHAKEEGQWPAIPTYAIATVGNVTSVTEGNTIQWTLTCTGVKNDTWVYWTIGTISGPTMDLADFDGENLMAALNGWEDNPTQTVTRTVTAEQNPGDAESNSFRVYMRVGGYGGTVVDQTPTITVVDAIAYGTDISSSFYEISNRFINSQTYMGNSSDYNGPYDVGEIQQSASGTKRIYLGVKVTASTTYYNDLPIAGVQHLNSSNVVQNTWIFNGSSSTWTTTTSQVTGTSTVGIGGGSYTPSQAASLTYSSISTSVGTTKFGLRNSTGSWYTGADNGITNITTAWTVGNGTLNQTATNNYLYRETSGSTRWSTVFCRSPTFSITSGDRIRVAHALTGPTSMASTYDDDDSLWIGVY
tara:strand:- start:12003 stop:13169 length:1167 start_codon:yes stop_codon:yes gene_type:complete